MQQPDIKQLEVKQAIALSQYQVALEARKKAMAEIERVDAWLYRTNQELAAANHALNGARFKSAERRQHEQKGEQT